MFKKEDGSYVRTIGVTGKARSGIHQLNEPYAVAVEPGPDGIFLCTWWTRPTSAF